MLETSGGPDEDAGQQTASYAAEKPGVLLLGWADRGAADGAAMAGDPTLRSPWSCRPRQGDASRTLRRRGPSKIPVFFQGSSEWLGSLAKGVRDVGQPREGRARRWAASRKACETLGSLAKGMRDVGRPDSCFHAGHSTIKNAYLFISCDGSVSTFIGYPS